MIETPTRRFGTLAVHAGEPRPRIGDAVAMPVFQSSTYLLGGPRAYDDIRYIRLNNTPNHEAVAAKIAALEGTETALLASSGMAAITTALLAHLESGDHVIAQDCLYGGTRHFLEATAPRYGISVSFVSMDDPLAWRDALKPRTRVLYCEATTNPLLQVGRLDEAADFAKRHSIVSLVDSTFATPLAFRPAEHGFDLVLHSATKFMGGHTDIVAGVVAGSRERVTRVRQHLNLFGGSLDPHACSLLHRGLKTLHLRYPVQCANALALATALSRHRDVTRVHHPGLPEDPSHERARRLFGGLYGGVVSFVPRGDVGFADAVLSRLTIPLLAPSLGGVETLVTRPATTSHAGLSPEERQSIGIPEEMIRVAVGVEDAEDLVADFEQALAG
jgi:cystathionine gamma-synthase/cystathionine gamma-lyase/cystathionine beta-lyase